MPTLERAAGGTNPRVAAAARSAINGIRDRPRDR
jgi:hypothetical protein